MRRFVILEKYNNWLWASDEVVYHDRDFLIVWAQQSKDMFSFMLIGYVFFDNSILGKFTTEELNVIARVSRTRYFKGLPFAKNKHIFAPSHRRDYVLSEESQRDYLELLKKTHTEILETVMI